MGNKAGTCLQRESDGEGRAQKLGQRQRIGSEYCD